MRAVDINKFFKHAKRYEIEHSIIVVFECIIYTFNLPRTRLLLSSIIVITNVWSNQQKLYDITLRYKNEKNK